MKVSREHMGLNQKLRGLLSLAMKAGKLEVGEGRAKDAIYRGGTFLIVVSGDASENTKKKFCDMAAFRKIPIEFISDRGELGSVIGRDFAVTMAVMDKGFADGIKKLIDG